MFFSWIIWFVFSPLVTYGLIFLVLAVIFSWLYFEWNEYKIRRKCQQQNLRYVRTPSQIFTIIFKKPYHDIENKLIDQNGTVYGCNMFNTMTITVANAELTQIVCNKEFTKLANRRAAELINDPVFDNFLFTVNDENWKRIRAIVSPTFSAGKLRKVKFCIDETAQTMTEHLGSLIQNNSIINVKSVIGSFTMDTIIQMAYGVKVDSLRDPNNRMIKMAQKLFGTDISVRDTLLFAGSIVCPSLIRLTGLRFQADVIDFFTKCSLDIIQKKRKEMSTKSEKTRASNFIELLLEVEQEQQESENSNGTNSKSTKYLTNDELIAQCVTFFTVGYDTTASTITNACHLLAVYPDKQEKLHQSIVKTLDNLSMEMGGTKDLSKLVLFDTLNRFEYLSAVLDESLRIYSTVNAVERQAADDLHLETSDKKIRFDVKKNDVIRIIINHLHHNPENFSKPFEFIPERFLPDNDSGETCNKHAFIPFGSGPRNCLARSLARLESKIALIYLVRHFKFHVCDETKIDFYVNADISITKDLWLKVEKRV